jgi:hypothetical protein
MFSFLVSLRKRFARRPSSGGRNRAMLRYRPHLEILEARLTPTQGLHVVPSAAVANSSLNAPAVISSTDAWAVGEFTSPSSGLPMPLAEHFNGTAWSAVPMAALPPGITANSKA